jgi:hypothetical protein
LAIALLKTIFKILRQQCSGGEAKFGGITNWEELKENLAMNCIPESMLNEKQPTYEEFLQERHRLMAQKLKSYYESL